MTPEERFTKIENLLAAMTEHHAKHDEQIGALQDQMKKQNAAFQAQLEKQNEGIRDLIRVSRTLVDSHLANVEFQKEVTNQIHELREAQKDTDGKLNILIDTVDRSIRNKNGNA